MTILLPYQIEGVQKLKDSKGVALLADDMGLGKAQPLESLLLTPDGYKSMGSIKIGDNLIGSEGEQIFVTGVYPQGIKEVFRITFTDGSTVECCDDHLWSVNSPLRKNRGKPPKTKTLYSIRNSLTHKNGNKQHFIPLVKEINCFLNQIQEIDCYFLGYILANGCLTRTSIVTISIPDEETVLRIRELVPEGLTLKKCNETDDSSVDYRISKLERTGGYSNVLLDQLRRLGLNECYSNSKFIPKEYLYGSIKQRKRLFQGLMDGDGSVSTKDNHLEYSTASKELATNVKFLIQSLGGIVKIKSRRTFFTYKQQRKEGQTSYRLSIALPYTVQPFLLNRKAKVYRPREKYQPVRAFAKVESVGKKQCQCISVSAKDGLYITNNCVLTHNTAQFLFWAVENNQYPIVVVCPKGLKRHWEREAKIHCNLKATVLYGTFNKKVKNLKENKLYIVNYDILPKWIRFLKSKDPKVIAGDEIHLCGNMQTLRSRAFKFLCKGVKQRMGISGTPLTNKTWELFPILNILWPLQFDSPFSYGMKYCHGENSFGRWKFTGSKNTKALHEKLIKLGMIRRTRLEVLPQLPPKRRIILPLDIENRKEYNRAEQDIIAWLSETDIEAAMRASKALRYTKFGYLLRLAAMLKMKPVLEWLHNFIDTTEGKILVGAKHRIKTSIIPMLYEEFKDISVQIHGGMTTKQRENAENRFRQDPKCRMCIGQLVAAGVGLNFPECTSVAMVEFPWAPGSLKQFEDRCYRLTSKQPVNVWYFPAFETVEEKLFEIIQKKERILDQVLDGVDTQESSLTIWDELQTQMTKKLKKGKKK